MAVGVLLNTSAASTYLWLQTGGPTNCLHVVVSYEGDAKHCIPCYAHGGASQLCIAYNSTTTVNNVVYPALQVIGHRYATSDIGGPGGTPTDDTINQCIWLTILN